jgi:hypothetical protein
MCIARTLAAKVAWDARRAPEWICDAHVADQLAYFERHRRPAATGVSISNALQPETRAIQRTMVSGSTIASASQMFGNNREASEYQAVEDAERDSLRSSPPQDVYLLPQCPNLCLERYPRPK